MRRGHDKICHFCEKTKNECEKGCQCTHCVFDSQVETFKEKHREVYDFWIKQISDNFEDLFEKAFLFEEELQQRWKEDQLAVLKKLDTKINDWNASSIQTTLDSYRRQTVVQTTIPDGYKMINPYYEYVDKKEDFLYNFHCQICGQDVKKRFFIQNDKLKYIIGIGGICCRNFIFSERVFKIIQKDVYQRIRDHFQRNIPVIIRNQTAVASLPQNKDKKIEIDHIIKRVKKLTDVYQYPRILIKILQQAKELGFPLVD